MQIPYSLMQTSEHIPVLYLLETSAKIKMFIVIVFIIMFVAWIKANLYIIRKVSIYMRKKH